MTDAVALAALTAGLLFVLAALAAWHIWYALALSRVFTARETEPWRAWVPVMNEAELLRLGGQDPMKAALFLVPLVNVYAVVLKAIAAHRIGRDAERPGGLVALAVVLPPLWATLLAAPAHPDRVPAAAGRAAASAGPAPAPAPFAAPAAPAAFTAPPAPGGFPPPPVAAPSPYPAPPAAFAAPAAPAMPAPAATPAAPTLSPSLSPSSTPQVAPAAPPVSAPAGPDAPLTRRQAAELRRDGVDDATALVRAPAGWQLALPSGQAVALTERIVVLGRNPRPEPGAQAIAIEDSTKTVSKRHARLEWTGQVWTITDLGSTNGVTLRDGAAERLLLAEQPTPVSERFLLGDAALTLHRTA